MKMRITLLLIAATLLGACSSKSALTPEEAKSLAREAYIYAFPAVEHNKAIGQMINSAGVPFNKILVEARLFTAADTTVVSPNNDTYYLPAVLDIRNEPVVVSVPEIAGRRDFMIQLIDIFTNCPDYISKLATCNGPGNYLVARADWNGEVPAGIDRVIRIQSTVVLALGRIQVYGAEDKDAETLAKQFDISPLSSYTKSAAPQSVSLKWPAQSYDAKTGDAEGFFSMFNYIIQYQLLNEADKALLEKYAAIGLGVGKEFGKANFSPEVWSAIEEGADEAKAEIKAHTDQLGRSVNGWQFSPQNAGRWGTDYMTNAAAAWKYIYVNTPEEALYLVGGVDNSGVRLDGSTGRYTLNFTKEQIPQAKFFWSLTIYGHRGYFMANELGRNTLNSASELVYEKDGSLKIYIQKENPGAAKEANWLPAPGEEFYMILRMYGPTDDVIAGKWQIPPVEKAQ